MSHKFGSAHLFIHLQCKISRSSVCFYFFFRKVRYHKVTNSSFWKQIQMGSKSSKSPKNGPKISFLGSHIHFYIRFCFSKKFLMVFQLFVKRRCLGKILFLVYGPKTSRSIRTQDSYNCNISQISWGIKLNFCM